MSITQISCSVQKGSMGLYSCLWKTHRTATKCHLTYMITLIWGEEGGNLGAELKR